MIERDRLDFLKELTTSEEFNDIMMIVQKLLNRLEKEEEKTDALDGLIGLLVAHYPQTKYSLDSCLVNLHQLAFGIHYSTTKVAYNIAGGPLKDFFEMFRGLKKGER